MNEGDPLARERERAEALEERLKVAEERLAGAQSDRDRPLGRARRRRAPREDPDRGPPVHRLRGGEPLPSRGAPGGRGGSGSSWRRTTPCRVAFVERTVAADETSLAGWVAVHGVSLLLADAYAIPKDAPFRHNDAFDRAAGYRTHAVLVVPMKDHQGELVGVLQLMNRKRRADGADETYPEDLVPLVLSLATQAAVCLKANRLTASIRKLFEDFAQAAIFAVEQRDPTTAGHSHRVASLTDTPRAPHRPGVGRAVRGRLVFEGGSARDPDGGTPPRLRKDRRPRARPREGEEARRERDPQDPRPLRLRPRGGRGRGAARAPAPARRDRRGP